ncbi:25-hydroxycholesterol 7-alpha-hydroxylase 1 [Phlyctema vagabunda]|uniref:25-hydroxycholesterol 7-alpha-hydroxylase 1 n=1 Tax=Phlyctema vagabunda TaxID=108571 RepID=A0ABR4PF59_9HELO
MPSLITGPLLAGITLVTIFACFRGLIWLTHDENEPPVLGDSIPFLTPILGILRHRTNFMVRLRDRNPSVPIYTLRLPGSRIYVINSPSLVPLVQRQKRVIAFEPIPARAAANMMGVSKAGVEIISRDCTGDDAYFATFLKATYPALASSGPGLDAMNRAAVEVLATSMMEGLEVKKVTVDLWAWVRHQVLMATTEAIYGPRNPFRDPATEKAWYDFEQGIMLQMLQVHHLCPQGRSSLEARESMVRAFHRYFDQGGHQIPNVPSLCLVQARYQHNLAHALSLDDIVRTEIGQVAASLSNTIPAAFWMLWHVLKDPVVLTDCRNEIERLAVVERFQHLQPDGRSVEKEVCTIDVSQLTNRQSCPTLTSTWYEVLRYNHVGISARMVMQDALLDGYLLKKDSTVMIVSPVMHSDLSVWGPSANEFWHRRFIHNGSNSTDHAEVTTIKSSKSKRMNYNKPEKSPANRIFGGGSTLCPGRHFASQEVMSLLALTIMRFNVCPVGRSDWISPLKDIPLPTSLPIPRPASSKDLDIDMMPRYPGREWRVIFGDSNAIRGVM